MIVPMKKVSLIVLDREKREALSALRKAGVMHLQDVQGNGAELAALKSDYAKLEAAKLSLSEVKPPKGKAVKQLDLNLEQAVKKAVEISALFSTKKNYEEEITKNTRDLERMAKWGACDPADFEFLLTKGIILSLYEIPPALYAALGDAVSTVLVNEDKLACRFLLLESGENTAENLPPEAISIPLCEKSTVTLTKEIETYRCEIADINADILESLDCVQAITARMKELSAKITFENVHSGMEREEGESVHALAWLTGFVPLPELQGVKELAAKEHWGLTACDPAEDDNVPTQLKNSKLVQLLYPLLDFLGTVPGYREFDISAWFLFFFSIFFAMIFGDAGYGSLLLIAGIGGALAAKMKKQPVPLIMQLLILLSCTTIIWGTLTCTWFGIPSDKLPSLLRNAALPIFSNENPESGTNIQIFCFTLALAQLSIGHIIALLRNIRGKTLKLLADFGSLCILWGMFTVVLNLLVSAERFPLTTVTFALIGGGFALSFIFSNYEGNLLKSILASLTNIISVLLGVINFFSDIVSYIRLWAVGLAGGAIAQTVNTMAGPMLGGFILFFGVLLLVFGHGLNMILNVLSVIVHGVRLNTLEFTSHVGMAWSGFKYEPFKE